MASMMRAVLIVMVATPLAAAPFAASSKSDIHCISRLEAKPQDAETTPGKPRCAQTIVFSAPDDGARVASGIRGSRDAATGLAALAVRKRTSSRA